MKRYFSHVNRLKNYRDLIKIKIKNLGKKLKIKLF